MQQRPVLYLDLDDTVISWKDGSPSGAAGLREFLVWALQTFQVRWLSRWARNGCMDPGLLRDLAKMSGVEEELLVPIDGLDWDETDDKLNGIAWLEHVVLQRPFVWVEDESVGTVTTDFLALHGFGGAHYHCNVTRDQDALARLHQVLLERFGGEQNAA